jgi:methylated-DNA-[protein]-cysteine S-methyltransferase
MLQLTGTTARYRITPNSIAPFAIIEHAADDADDAPRITTTWLTERGRELHLARSGDGASAIDLREMDEDAAMHEDLAARLEAYFAGEPITFSDVPLPHDARAFTRRCWSCCRAIRRGSVLSYAELAARAGSPGAARAAGQAMRTNPLPVIVPCHRVIGSGGQLHGYAGQTDCRSRSLAIKQQLLELEGYC